MGSGKLIRRAFQKYGIEKFSIEYLGIYDSEWKMNLAEKIFVVIDPELSYNLCPGGQGGFGYINKIGKNRSGYGPESIKKMIKSRKVFWTNSSDEYKKNRLEKLKNIRTLRKNMSLSVNFSTKGRKHTEEAKVKISESKIGNKNSQFGTKWKNINNGIVNKKIKPEELEYWLSQGYKTGFIKKSKNNC